MRNPKLSVTVEVLASWKMSFPLSDLYYVQDGSQILFLFLFFFSFFVCFLASGHMVNKKINLDPHELIVLWVFIMACNVLSVLCRPSCSISICLARWPLQRYSGLVMLFIYWYSHRQEESKTAIQMSVKIREDRQEGPHIKLFYAATV